VDLGHDFITDVLELRLDQSLAPLPGHWASIAYAVLEGVTQTLGIRRDDMNATWRRSADNDGCVFLYDAVPGGAGHVARIHEHLSNGLTEALRRVTNCSCEETTSCYECLRSFGNQRFHGQITRGVAKDFLESVLGAAAVAARRPARAPDSVTQALGLITDPDLRDVITRLVAGGVRVPEIGYELLDEAGRVVAELEVAWPTLRVGVSDVVVEAPREEIVRDWKLFEKPAVCESAIDLLHALQAA